jgi:hypothetical protein
MTVGYCCGSEFRTGSGAYPPNFLVTWIGELLRDCEVQKATLRPSQISVPATDGAKLSVRETG